MKLIKLPVIKKAKEYNKNIHMKQTVSDKHIILSWCTAASVTFCFVLRKLKQFRATETLGLAELLRLINWDVLKRG